MGRGRVARNRIPIIEIYTDILHWYKWQNYNLSCIIKEGWLGALFTMKTLQHPNLPFYDVKKENRKRKKKEESFLNLKTDSPAPHPTGILLLRLKWSLILQGLLPSIFTYLVRFTFPSLIRTLPLTFSTLPWNSTLKDDERSMLTVGVFCQVYPPQSFFRSEDLLATTAFFNLPLPSESDIAALSPYLSCALHGFFMDPTLGVRKIWIPEPCFFHFTQSQRIHPLHGSPTITFGGLHNFILKR